MHEKKKLIEIGLAVLIVAALIFAFWAHQRFVINCRSACKAQYGAETRVRIRQEPITADSTRSVCECIDSEGRIRIPRRKR